MLSKGGRLLNSLVILCCIGLWFLYGLMLPSSGRTGHYNNKSLDWPFIVGICCFFFSSFFPRHYCQWDLKGMLMMMMMLKKKKGSLAVLALLVASVNCILPSQKHLTRKFHDKNSFLFFVFLNLVIIFISHDACSWVIQTLFLKQQAAVGNFNCIYLMLGTQI